jgi:hypothetical protein
MKTIGINRKFAQISSGIGIPDYYPEDRAIKSGIGIPNYNPEVRAIMITKKDYTQSNQ